MKTVWILLVAFGAAFLELAAGFYALAVPAVAVAAFYLASVFGWRAAAIPVMLAAAAVDFQSGRHVPATALLVLPGVMALARFWRNEGNCRMLPLQAVPGVLCGALQAAILLPLESFGQERFFWRLLAHNLWLAFQMAASGALLTPVLCGLLDRPASKLGLRRYQAVAEPQAHHHAQ